jgi:predicted ArsR family transcriptional regulator
MPQTTKNKDKACTARPKTTTPKRSPGAARVTKKQELIRLLKKKAGADIATLSARFGWQRHTTRAALSGLRKVGVELEKIEASDGKPTRYRIAEAPSEPVAPERKETATDAR